MNVAVDFALIQPLVFPLEPWLSTRRALAEFIHEGAELPDKSTGTVLHLQGIESPLFDRSLDEKCRLGEAFPALLEQARDLPCLSIAQPEMASAIFENDSSWPAGIEIDSLEVHLLLPRSGELVLLHLFAGTLDSTRIEGEGRLLQRELRTAYLERIGGVRDRLRGRLRESLTPWIGGESAADGFDLLSDAGGHLVTLAHDPLPEIVEALGRVHLLQEGTMEDQSGMLRRADDLTPGFAHFGWAYSTVALSDLATLYRLLFPLIAVNQAWYRYRVLRGDIIRISRTIHALESDRELIAQTEFYNQVVLDVKIWEAERESFERGLRPIYRSVYDHLWRYWDTDRSKETVHEGIAYLREFLDRKYSVKHAIRDNTQAKILFVIAIFQLLSVFGLVSGYLYFWEQTDLPESAIYGSKWMVWGTIVSPIVVLVVITWLLVSFFRRHR